jgi:hypothetical protein
MSNYPDGMDWGSYDDYHDPKLQCGHRSSDSCDCWCEHGSGSPHLVGHCDSDNCALLQCSNCGEPVENDEDSYIICKECITERGCQCKDGNRTVWVDCMLGATYPSPARFATQFKNLQHHWTHSPFSADERREKEAVVFGVRCTSCSLGVD